VDESQKVLELVVFRAKDGVSHDQLLSTVDAVSNWALAQPGFISRELAYSPETNQWIEVIWWQTRADADAAAAIAMTDEACTPMFALIDMESVLFLHGKPGIAPVQAAVDNELRR
jgi:hypothetical protein